MFNAEVTAYFSKEGVPNPYKVVFYNEHDESVVLNVNVFCKKILL